MKKILVLFSVLFFANSIIAQNEPNDCVNAIVVCGNGSFSSNASGIGDTQEVSGCGGSEHNSIWLKINIVQSGTLGFDLIPDDADPSVDYDFWVYGPNKSCSALGSPIRCATTNPVEAGMTNNHTGMNLATTLTQTGPGSNGNGYVRSLTVTAGQFYYIAIDRPEGDGGFEIQWTGTATANGGAFPTPPTANQIPELRTCSNTPNIGIFDLNSVRSQINSNTATTTITFYTSFANAIDGLSPLPNIIANTSNPQTIYAKVVDNISGCYTITDFNLRVYPVPSANISISDTQVCLGDDATVTFTGTQGATVEYTVNGGPIQTVLLDALGQFQFTNSITINTTYTLVTAKILDTNNNIVCSQTENDTVTVTVLVNTPVFTQVAAICPGGTLSALPTTSNNGITGIWSPALNNTTTTTYTFTPTVGQCASNVTMTITVNTNATPTFTQVAPICSGGTLSPLPITSNEGITGSWSPALNNTATTTYTFQPTSGLCATSTTMIITVNSIVTPTFTQIAPICSGGTISALPIISNNGINGTWSPALNNTATTTYTFQPNAGECATTTTMTITVNPIVTPTFTQVASICSGGTLSALPTTSNNGIAGTWSPVLNSIATTIYTFTPNAGECAVSTTMTIMVNPNVIPTFTQVAPICSGEVLSALPTTSNNGITGTWSPALNNAATTIYTFQPTAGLCATGTTMTITVSSVIPIFTQVAPICFGTTLSALPTTSNNGITGIWSPALDNTTTTTYTFTPTIGQCASSTSMTIVVNQLVTPVFTHVSPICSGETLSVLPTISTNGITGTWSPALNNTATTTYTFQPTAGQCARSATMTITVTSKPIITVVNNSPSICSGEPIDIVLNCNNMPNATIHWTYQSSSVTGGSNGSSVGPIHLTDLLTLNNNISIPTTVSIIVYGEGDCRGDETEVNILINPLPTPVITNGFICIDGDNNVISNHIFDTGLSSSNHSFTWYYNGIVIPGAIGSTYTVDQISEVGLYSVETTNTVTGCNSIRFSAVVESSFAAETATYTVSNYFEDNQMITISVVGTGDYLYSLDNGPFQESNVFSHVSPGEHSVTVHDTNGCTNIIIDNIFTIGYPNFFTPNGDGYHDTWNVWSLSNQHHAEIFIFDRYGKFIKEIKPEGEGWNGTFNGQNLPATDYWFTIKYNENQEEKIFKAHFTLKR